MKLVTFDTETSGVDVENDRILTCFVRAKDGDDVAFEENWVLDPGIEVPEGASEVHGMTTEWIREHGRKDVKKAILEICNVLEVYAHDGYVVAGYNHSFDLAILDAELRRHAGIDLTLSFPPGTKFIDPIIIDRKVDRFRKGSRKLVDVAQHYGIEVDEAKLHEASEDVHITEQLIPKVLNKAWKVFAKERAGMTPDEFIEWLQPKQAEWKAQWAKGLTKYFAKEGKKEDDGSPIVVNGGFPW